MKGMINLYGIEMLVFRQNMESLFAKKNFARRTQKVSMKLYQAIRILPIFTTGHFYIDIHRYMRPSFTNRAPVWWKQKEMSAATHCSRSPSTQA